MHDIEQANRETYLHLRNQYPLLRRGQSVGARADTPARENGQLTLHRFFEMHI